MAGVLLLPRLIQMKVRTRTRRMTLKEWIMTPVMENKPRANPKDKGNINLFTIRESVEGIPMKIWEEKYGKERNVTVTVCL